ncbi:MAG: tryptophan-5-halogenase [Chthoniobacteraceae bacterium]|nr:tryptophan-5-halogenase [Chthoniobacteraceae bacterium]
MINSIIVLGGGSAGLITALTLKRRLPGLAIRVIRSPEIGIIGVGEGTTGDFRQHFFQYLGLKPRQFYLEAAPTWKLGIRFIWGPLPAFFYTFGHEYDHRYPDLSRNTGFFHGPDTTWLGRISAHMAHDKVFPRRPDNLPDMNVPHGFHVENVKLVGWLENTCRILGVAITEGTMRDVERKGTTITALKLEDGERVTADLFVDATGFRSELLSRTFEEPYVSYADSLFCDRAVIAGWARTDEVVHPYTTAETMKAGWSWQIEHEHWINRGYVYSSRFISDDEARQEFLSHNLKVSTEPRLVKFRSGRYARAWVGNVIAIGNAAGFVEPLEATALQVICVQARGVADALTDGELRPTATAIAIYNELNGNAWDDIRDFLAVHYAFNTRLNTPFWQACRSETNLGGAQRVVEYYQDNGPSVLGAPVLLRPTNSFGMEGYLAILCGQQLPHGRPHQPLPAETDSWKKRNKALVLDAQRAFSVQAALQTLRSPAWKW